MILHSKVKHPLVVVPTTTVLASMVTMQWVSTSLERDKT